MSVLKRGKTWYLRIRPFGEQVKVRTSAESKKEAMQIERAVLTACVASDFGALDPRAREACVRMFRNQHWEIPADLCEQEPVRAEMTLWKGVELFLNYPEIAASNERSRYAQCLVHIVEHFGKGKPIKSIWVPEIKQYMAKRMAQSASPSQVNREKGTLSRMFQVLAELRLVEVNPCRLIKNLSQKPEQREVYLSFSDVQRIIEASPEWFQPIIMTDITPGCDRARFLD